MGDASAGQQLRAQPPIMPLPVPESEPNHKLKKKRKQRPWQATGKAQDDLKAVDNPVAANPPKRKK